MPREKLRNFGKFLGVYLLTLVAICAMTLSFTSCRENTRWSDYDDTSDSLLVASTVEAIVNPSFGSVQEVTLFQNRLAEEYSIDEEFRTMPAEILTNVAYVCLSRSSYVTKKDIILEYRANRAVYDNLPSDPPEKKTAPIVRATSDQKDSLQEKEHRRSPYEILYHYETDTINGQPHKVLVKEERTYEE